MKKFIINILRFSIFPIIFFSAIVAYNVVFDPFGVIRGDMENQVIEPNQHYLKVKYILENPNKYNAFLFGSSKIGKINVANIDGDNKWYNMTYSMGVPEEHLTDLKLFLEAGVRVNEVIIGLDEISYIYTAADHTIDPLRKPYASRADMYMDYLGVFRKRINICKSGK